MSKSEQTITGGQSGADQFEKEVETILENKYGLREETAQLLIRKYSLRGFLCSLRDRFPLTPEQTADTMVEGLVSFYKKQSE